MVPDFESPSNQGPSSPESEKPSSPGGRVRPDFSPTTEPALLSEDHTFPCKWGCRYLQGPLGNSHTAATSPRPCSPVAAALMGLRQLCPGLLLSGPGAADALQPGR